MFPQEEYNAHEEVNEIQVSIDQAREAVQLRDDLRALQKNRAFKKIIVEGYFKGESHRLVIALAEPEMQTEERQAKVITDIKAIGSLRQFFELIEQAGDNMEDAIKKSQDEIDNIRQSPEYTGE